MLEAGDILVVNTNWWFHETKVRHCLIQEWLKLQIMPIEQWYLNIEHMIMHIETIKGNIFQVLPGELSITVTSEFD